jgi:hypothetical protein
LRLRRSFTVTVEAIPDSALLRRRRFLPQEGSKDRTEEKKNSEGKTNEKPKEKG